MRRWPPAAGIRDFRRSVPTNCARIAIELSILGPLEPVATLDDIEIGRHGLLVEQGRRRGLLLPQVAVEHQWTAAMFVSQTCRKAGLSDDAWQRGAVSGSSKPKSSVSRKRRRDGTLNVAHVP